MPTLSKTSELEAVNYILSTIGLSSVNSLAVGIADVSISLQVLHEVSRRVQSRGWWFNSDSDFTFPRNISNEIELPQDVLKVDAFDCTRNLIERGGKLYDKDNQTYLFEDNPGCDVVWFLPYEELPQVARDYILTKAARNFQKRTASEIILEISEVDEAEALQQLLYAEEDAEDVNVLANTRLGHIIKHRRFNP